MKRVSFENGAGYHRIELVQESEGVYVLVFEREASQSPERDYLDDDFTMAMDRCLEDFGVPLNSWREPG